MNTGAPFQRWAISVILFLIFAATGCETETKNNGGSAGESGTRAETPKKDDQPAKPSKDAEPVKKAPLGKNVWLETQGQRRRVLVSAEVCLREGSFGLECLLCKKNTKEHESILATAADARIIHAGLLAAAAEPGSPVKFVEKGDKVTIIPPSGAKIMVTLQYEHKGKVVSVPAQEWIREGKTKKYLKQDWVFAGSLEYPDPDDKKKKHYAASSDGAYICVLNVPTAMLDLPISNPNRPPEERELQPYTDRIPPLETKVMIVLEPIKEDKKK